MGAMEDIELNRHGMKTGYLTINLAFDYEQIYKIEKKKSEEYDDDY